MTRTVALVGFMGAGKSTLGPPLARALHMPFVDLDVEIEAEAGPIPAIFASEGEAGFRAREAALLKRVLAGPPVVLACGGGAPIFGDAMDQLLAAARVIYLDAPLEDLAERVGTDKGRPLWDSEVASRHARRMPIYARAHIRLDARMEPEALLRAALQALEAGAPCA